MTKKFCFIMMRINLPYYFIPLIFVYATHAQLIRSYFESRALFYKPMENNKVLSITPLYSYTNISTISLCVRSCVNMTSCFAVNYGFRDFICELLDQDRSSKLSSDFVERIDYVYLDVLTHFDGCYIGESCYPCFCQANSYTREPCDCTSSSDVPSPDVHIPLKKLQKDTGTSPYGRGDDNHNGTDVTIVPSTGRISKDQFGKENALHSINKYMAPQPLEYGGFTNTALSPREGDNITGSVSFWFRTTVNMFDAIGCDLLKARNHGAGFTVGLYPNSDPSLLNINVWFWPTPHLEVSLYITTATYEELRQWTHVVITFSYQFVPHPSCAFPFEWGDIWYDKCANPDQDTQPWCYFADDDWDYCIKESTGVSLYINGVLKDSSENFLDVSPPWTHTSPLISTCHRTYMNDIAIWYSRITDATVTKIYDNDVSNPKWDLSKNIVTAGSCKALQDENPSLQTNGYYWILLDGHMIAVWCDMEIDGGGWTRVSYTDVSIVGLAQRQSIEVDDLSSIGETYKGNIFLSYGAMRTLQTLIGFRQIRVFCQAPEFHNRIVDIATTNPAIVDKWLERATPAPNNYCSVFYRLEDDTSIMFSACSEDDHVTLPLLNKFTNFEFDHDKRFRMGWHEAWNCDEVGSNLGGEFMVFVR